jgi:hypothetical protein
MQNLDPKKHSDMIVKGGLFGRDLWVGGGGKERIMRVYTVEVYHIYG